MENLIIIGNGFDLAHGLKTSYSNFLSNLRKKVQNSPENYSNIVYTSTNSNGKVQIEERNVAGVKNQWSNRLIHCFMSLSGVNLWSDIEYSYFKALQNYNHRGHFINSFGVDYNYKSAEELNQEFQIIKDYLEKYLTDEQKDFKKIEGFSYLFSKFNNEHTTVLNFNYTNTVNEYLKNSKRINLNHIHGEVKNPDNPIIFGFAANDKESKELIDKDDNELMRNIKRVNYKLTDNEFRLKRQLDDEETQWVDILIIGHSCGVSDKLILNEILNHKKINSIRVLHYNEIEGYRNIAINIDRIVDDYSKEKSEPKVFPKLLNYKMCCKMIQHNSMIVEVSDFKKYIDDILIEQEKMKEKLSEFITDFSNL